MNALNPDIVHLHWLGSETISIRDIGRIEKPVVWTLHDMWPFCGAEHYTEDTRWCVGYSPNNRPAYESGFDVNRWMWNRKQKNWTRPAQMVAPSNWLADCVRNSALMKDWPVEVIPYALDTDKWKPIDKSISREILDLPSDTRLLCFGADGSSPDPRKGFDLLVAALERLEQSKSDLELVVFGFDPRISDLKHRVHFVGRFQDDLSLRVLYSAVDALVLPSRQDNLPNVGVEALACGTPVLAFNVCGLPDLVRHRENGWLARPFDVDEFAEGIEWVLHDQERLVNLSQKARAIAEDRFAYPIVARRYRNLYEKVLS